MIQLTVSPTPRLDSIIQSLHATESQLQRAIVRTLNKTARWLHTRISRETAHELNINVGVVRRSLVIVRAKRGVTHATVGLGKKSGVINAIHLGNARQNARGVRVARRQYDHAFIATMPTGHRGIFRRKDASRLPIKEIHIVITGRMAKVMEQLSEGPAIQQFDRIFERELNFILRNETT